MSLPSQAVFYDIDLNQLGTTFVNCGWWVSGNGVWRELDHACSNPPVGTVYVMMYHRLIDIRKLGQMETKEDQIDFLDKLYKTKIPDSVWESED
jgi:hypothetical protein